MQKFLKQFGIYVGALLVAFVVFVGMSVVSGANPPPTNNPPAGNVAPPINTGIDLQVKSGIIGADDLWLTATASNPTIGVRDALLQMSHYHLEVSSFGQKCEFGEGVGEDKNCVGNMTTVRAPSFLKQIVARLVPRAQAYVGFNDPGIQPPVVNTGRSNGVFALVAGYAMEFCKDQDGCSFVVGRRFMSSGEQFIRSKGVNQFFVSPDDRWAVSVDQGDDPETGNKGNDGAGGDQHVANVQGECVFTDGDRLVGGGNVQDNGPGFGLHTNAGAGVCVLDIWD